MVILLPARSMITALAPTPCHRVDSSRRRPALSELSEILVLSEYGGSAYPAPGDVIDPSNL
jgi:hypothetical protein